MPVSETSAGPSAPSKSRGFGFEWVSSSPTPAAVSELERRFPEVVSFPSVLLEDAISGWKELAVIARTFNRWVSPDAFIREFRRAGVPGEIKPLSLAHRCHIFKFESSGSKGLVLDRPWVVNGQPAALEEWRPEFLPSPVAVSRALLWVRLPSLPVEFWSEEMLREILAPAGEFVCSDSATRSLSRGSFARACIRVDLRQPLRPGVRLQGLGAPFWQQFQFEHLDGICSLCGTIHLTGECHPPSSDLELQQPLFGPWMSAVRRRRGSDSGQTRSSKVSVSSQAAPDPSSSGSLKLNRGSDGWISPLKVARRNRPGGSTISQGKVSSPGSALHGNLLRSDRPLLISSGDDSLNQGGDRAGYCSIAETENNKSQSAASLPQSSVGLCLLATNPFAILAKDVGDHLPSPRPAATPASCHPGSLQAGQAGGGPPRQYII